METLVSFGETIIFIVMLIASILAIAVGTERAIVFKRNTKSTDSILKNLIDKIRKKDINGASEFSRQSVENVYARFADLSLEHYKDGHDGLQELMEGQIIHERIGLEKRLTILNSLGNNAPFIGLLGTVLGVINAFNGLGTLGNAGAEVVMRGISTALFATAGGLFLAIPVVMVNNYFSKKVKVIMQNLEILSKEILASQSAKKTGSARSHS
ncbi:MAG: MotA/TolQ/ExbB proton channel family protein [Leptospira sp.]|nr:MotA/TolQ/ExbB proton channel family protein [Leptospira sp.]